MSRKKAGKPANSNRDAKKAHKRGSVITGDEVIRLLKATPMDWGDLKHALNASSGGRLRTLRAVLKGLVRSEDVFLDHQGQYQSSQGERLIGPLDGTGRRLTFEGEAVELDRDNQLRAGDVVAAIKTPQGVRVLEILSHTEAPLVGKLVADTSKRQGFPFVESLTPEYKGRVTLLEPPTRGAPGDTVTVKVTGVDRRGLVGVVVDVIEAQGSVAQVVETLVTAYQIPRQWPEDWPVDFPAVVDPKEHTQRKDLTEMPLITIDGATAKDFDDAVFAQELSEGWRLVVAIADVAHYVKSGAALDVEAQRRGNSVYLPNRVIPMLPEELSNGLCSLRPQEHRLALVCDMQISTTGQVTGHDFYEAIIYSWQRLTYSQVADYLDSGTFDTSLGNVEPEVKRSVTTLHEVYRALRIDRDERGGLDFESTDVGLDIQQGEVVGLLPTQRNDAHRLIEEAMIAANVCAAQFLEAADKPGMYRVHEPPSGDKAQQMRQAMAFAGLRIESLKFTPLVVQQALQELGERPNRWVFESLILRSMMQAVYAPGNKGHFGLALTRYMHFTSPIRRYADLIVHRAIKKVIHNKSKAVATADQLIAIGEHISITERRAEELGWAIDGWLKCELIKPLVGSESPGIVAGVTEFGLFIDLTGHYVQGLLHISELGEDYFHFQAETMSLVGERSGQRFTLGDEVLVEIMDVQPQLGRINLNLIRKGKNKPAGKNKFSNKASKKAASKSKRTADKKKPAGKKLAQKKSSSKKSAEKKTADKKRHNKKSADQKSGKKKTSQRKTQHESENKSGQSKKANKKKSNTIKPRNKPKSKTAKKKNSRRARAKK